MFTSSTCTQTIQWVCPSKQTIGLDDCIFFPTGASPPSDVEAVQDGLTGITVTWTVSSDATGYRISYTSDSDSGSETVSDGSTETHTLTGLVNGETYTISIVSTASSPGPPRAPVEAGTVGLSKSMNVLETMCILFFSLSTISCSSLWYHITFIHCHHYHWQCSQWHSSDWV